MVQVKLEELTSPQLMSPTSPVIARDLKDGDTVKSNANLLNSMTPNRMPKNRSTGRLELE